MYLKHWKRGGICKVKLIMSVFGKKNCATYFILHDCQNCNVKNVDIYLLSWQILASDVQVLLFALSVPLYSNFPESPGIIGFL